MGGTKALPAVVPDRQTTLKAPHDGTEIGRTIYIFQIVFDSARKA
jgi:hypothetical protein